MNDRSRMWRAWPLLIILVMAASTAACAASEPRPRSAARPETSPSAGASPTAAAPVEVPASPARRLLPRRTVARGLKNPRGMQLVGNALLVSEAGTGDPSQPATGRLLELQDRNADGDYLDPDETKVLLDQQPSKNILELVRRDEVFGMAGMASDGRSVLVALAFFGGPSTLFEVRDGSVSTWGRTHGNINDVTYEPKRSAWFGVASTSDEVVRLVPGNGSERVLKLPPLAQGQDAVPGYVRADPVSGELLVTLFSGSPQGEEGGEGIEIVSGAGALVSVDPDSRAVHPVVVGLNVPTDLELGPDGSLYVLELCRAFLDPVGTREGLLTTSHGGFERFSGRLLRIDRARRSVEVIAEGLDAPTNLALASDGLYVATGMGTPGRPLPVPNGSTPLEGTIEHIAFAPEPRAGASP